MRIVTNASPLIFLTKVNSLGLLVLARRFGHLDEATAVGKFNQLVERHGLYLSSKITQQVRSVLAEPGSNTEKNLPVYSA